MHIAQPPPTDNTNTSTYVSAIARLQSLPEVFRGADITVRFGWQSKQASQYLWAWKQRGLIEPFGGHSDIFANLLVDADPRWETALEMCMPSGTLIGPEVLRRAMWATQIPNVPDVAIRQDQPSYSTTKFQLHKRGVRWYKAVQPGIEQPASGLQTLRPSWAIVEMLRTHKRWDGAPLHPDDIDWDAVNEDDPGRRDLAAACRALRVDEEHFSKYVSAFTP